MIRSCVCSVDREQTVLAHLRMVGISGAGQKAPDLLGSWACYPCHQLVDTGRFGDTELTRDDRDLLLLKGVARTQYQLLSEGKIKC
jgi:hypothetical protein